MAIPKRDSTEQILRAIRRIIRRTAEHSRQVTRTTGLSVPQSLCLRFIGAARPQEEITVALVANAIQLAPATVSRLLDRLEQAGLVLRERRSQDRRRVCLKLTPEGRKRLRKLPPMLQEYFTSRLEKLPKRKQIELLEALEAIVKLMEAVDMDAAPMLDSTLAID